MAVLQWSQKNRSRARVVTAFGVVSLVVSLAACEQSKEADKAKQAGAAPPPPAVVVAEVIQKTVPVYSEYVAQIEAKETVEIRARVQAFLAAQHFTEGTIVKKDQLLFTLDPREYEAKLLQAKAQLEGTQRETRQGRNRRAAPEASGCAAGRAPTGLRQRRRESRNRPRGSLGRQGRSRRGGTRPELLHDPLTDQRPHRQAAGVPGNLVGKGEATLLDTVSSVDPIRVVATISEAEYLRLRSLKTERMGFSVPLELVLADGSVFPHKGKLVIIDRAVDVKTGTLTGIAEFPNPDALLRPGQFGRVRAAVETAENAILIPKQAVQEIQGTKTVLVVGADNMVALRTIKPGQSVGRLLVVQDGLKPGERVIVDGIQKARPGTKVNPTAAPASSPSEAKGDEQAQGKQAEARPAAKTGGK